MAAEGFDFELGETALQELYTWIDEIPLSRPKKNISRDFSDGGSLDILAGCYLIHVLTSPFLQQ